MKINTTQTIHAKNSYANTLERPQNKFTLKNNTTGALPQQDLLKNLLQQLLNRIQNFSNPTPNLGNTHGAIIQDGPAGQWAGATTPPIAPIIQDGPAIGGTTTPTPTQPIILDGPAGAWVTPAITPPIIQDGPAIGGTTTPTPTQPIIQDGPAGAWVTPTPTQPIILDGPADLW
ncbi:hypothetical protein [Thiothrix eikelboomii]|uniref:hypothetical protein n=1 Tax=Thiothrix eikelboomii TaxID=92487 RepID=UPI003BAF8950